MRTSVDPPALTGEDVRCLPDPVLGQRCAEVDPLAADVVALGAAMLALMSASPACVGVAAPQVGVGWRVFVLDVTGHRKARTQHGALVLANPRVVERTGEDVARDVPRASGIVVAAVEVGTGRRRVVEADAFEARALQHEIDHLDGLLFLDRVRTPAGLHQRKRYA